MTTRVRAAWWALAVVLTLAGCTAHDGGPTSAPSARASVSSGPAAGSAGPAPATPSTATQSTAAGPTGITTLWTSTGLTPVSAPVAVGDVFVVYARNASGLVLAGLDAVTGRMRWEQAAGRGRSPADPLRVAASGATVAYLSPAAGAEQKSTVVVAAAVTGRDVVRSSPGWFSSDLSACSGSDWSVAGLCVSETTDDEGGWTYRRTRIDTATGLSSDPDAGLPAELDYSVPVAAVPGLRLATYVDDRRLIGVSGTRALWIEPMRTYLGKATTFGPLSLRQYGTVAIGTAVLADQQPMTGGGHYALDLGRDVLTFAVDLATGRLLWRTAGSSALCLAGAVDQRTSAAFRCQYTGRADVRIFDDPGRPPVYSVQASATVARIDPRTGKPSWTARVDDASALVVIPAKSPDFSEMAADPRAVAPGVGARVLLRGRSPQVLDLASGAVGAIAAGEVFWCEVSVSTPFEPADRFGTQVFSATSAAGLAQPCDASGRAVPAVGVSIPSQVGGTRTTSAGTVRAVAEPQAVVGYLLRPGDPSASTTARAGAAVTGPSKQGAPEVRTLVPAWTAGQLLPVTAPVVVGATAVYYGTADRTLFLAGLDLTTGKQRWRVEAGTAALSSGTPLAVSTFGERVLFFDPSGALDVLDPTRGTAVRLSIPRAWVSRPRGCADSLTEVCVTARNAAGQSDRTTDFAFDVAHGTSRIVDETADAPSEYDEIIGDLYSRGSGASQLVARFAGGRKVWERRVTDLFGPGTTSVRWQGLSWDGLLYTTTVERNVTPDAAGTYPPLHLASQLLSVAFSYATGQVTWRSTGTSLDCLGRLDRAAGAPGSPAGILACRYTGVVDGDPAGSDTFSTPRGVDVTLELLDERSGAVVWSRRLDAAGELSAPDGDVDLRWADAGHLLLQVPGGPVVVDLGSGATRRAAATDVFWCERDSRFQLEPSGDADTGTEEHAGGGIVEACDRTGTAVARSPGNLGTAAVAVAGSYRLVSTPEGVVAWRLVA